MTNSTQISLSLSPFDLNSIELNLDRRLNSLLQLVDELFKISPDSIQNAVLKKPPTPSTQKRLVKTSSTDRPDVQAAPVNIEQVGNLISRLVTASDDIRQFQKSFGEDRERERMRRNSMRRAVSIENGVSHGSDNERSIGRLSKSSTQNGILYRKSLSVDQSLGGPNPRIWKNPNDSNSSIQSIDSESHYGGVNYARDSSLDSRLSGGSTQSDLPRGTRKKKRSLMGKLKSLTKSSSKNNDTDGSVSLFYLIHNNNLHMRTMFIVSE